MTSHFRGKQIAREAWADAERESEEKAFLAKNLTLFGIDDDK